MTAWLLITCAVLASAALEDSRQKKIGKGKILFMILLGSLRPDREPAAVLQNAGNAMILFLALLAVYMASEGRVLGGGDVRLLAAEAFLLKEKEMITALLVSGILLLVYSLRCRKEHAGNRQIPAAVFLCPGMIFALFVSAVMTIRL